MSELPGINRYIVRVGEFFSEALGARLVEVYKLGSLAHGGFSPIYSDIDVGLLLDAPEPPPRMSEIISAAKDLDAEYGKRLSVFWGNPKYDWGRLPVIDRLDLLDHGVPLLRNRKAEFARPPAAEIHRALLDSLERSYTPRLPELTSLSHLETHQRKRYIRTVLYPARFIYTWDHLAVASNDRAVEYLHEVRPAGLDLEPIDRALACRNGATTVEDVFAVAPDLNGQFEAATRYVKSRAA